MAGLAFLSGEALKAGPVSEKTAQGIAERILSANSFRKGSAGVKLVWTGSDPKDQPAMYVFTGGSGGFVIISGDDNTVPVLAISDKGRFEAENMPAHVQWWMKRMEAQVRATKTPAKGVKKQWAKVAATRAYNLDETQVVDKVEHLTPEWDQGNNDYQYLFNGRNIYNKFCPVDPNSNDLENNPQKLSVTGCVATSIAEVLTTLSGLYPDQMPSKPEHATISYEIPQVYLDQYPYVANSPYELGETEYDWAGLRTLTDYRAIRQAIINQDEELLDQLGHLMADCGAIMELFYSDNVGTSGFSSHIPDRMSTYFSMSKTARVEKRSKYTDAQWIRMLKTELVQRPILYSGRTTDEKAGHAFVFDGFGRYGGEDVFHVNFGWSGIFNGYYSCLSLQIDENESYHTNCDAIFDFYPDKNKVTTEQSYLKLFSSISTSDPIVPGVPFTLSVGSVRVSGSQNYVSGGQSGDQRNKIYACFRKKDGSFTPIGSVSVNLQSSMSNWNGSEWSGNISCTIGSDQTLALGDCIALYYHAGNGVLKPIPFDSDGEIIGEFPVAPMAFIQTKGSYLIDEFFLLTIANYGAKYAGTVWTITYPDGQRVQKPQSYDSFQLTQTGRYKIEAAIAETVGGEVLERVVTFVTVE